MYVCMYVCVAELRGWRGHATVAQVSVDALEESITSLEELVQSVDIAAMNKI